MIPQSVFINEGPEGLPLTDFQIKLKNLKNMIVERKGQRDEETKKAFKDLLMVCNKFIPSEEKAARGAYSYQSDFSDSFPLFYGPRLTLGPLLSLEDKITKTFDVFSFFIG
jgi:hypothetical protein